MPTKKPSIGAQAYHTRRLTRQSWGEIADKIAYRVGVPNSTRRHSLMTLAKEYARRNGYDWPVGSMPAASIT